jgi:hypothetical protein
MAPKHSLDTSTNASSPDKRVRKATTHIVKKSHRENFDRLCALHNWTPSAAVRDKLANLIRLSGDRLQASELLPLAFVQHYPFVWQEDFLFLGYNDANECIWYKAFPTGRGLARGRYYDSSQTNILGKHTVTKFWQSWIDVFHIEKRGLDRSHEYFTGVYLILKKFPNLRYKIEQRNGDPRDPLNTRRLTGVIEYPFNVDHPFMQESTGGDVENDLEPERDVETDTDTDHEDQGDATFIKEEPTDSHGDDQDTSVLVPGPPLGKHISHADPREPTPTSPSHLSGHTANKQVEPYGTQEGPMSRPLHLSREPIFRASSSKSAPAPSSQASKIKPITKTRADSHLENDTPTPISHKLPPSPPSRVPPRTSAPTKSPYFARTRKQIDLLDIPRPKSQSYKDYTLRVPIDKPRWSNTNFKFAVMRSVYTLPM